MMFSGVRVYLHGFLFFFVFVFFLQRGTTSATSYLLRPGVHSTSYMSLLLNEKKICSLGPNFF